jgi:hypothetical protein
VGELVGRGEAVLLAVGVADGVDEGVAVASTGGTGEAEAVGIGVAADLLMGVGSEVDVTIARTVGGSGDAAAVATSTGVTPVGPAVGDPCPICAGVGGNGVASMVAARIGVPASAASGVAVPAPAGAVSTVRAVGAVIRVGALRPPPSVPIAKPTPRLARSAVAITRRLVLAMVPDIMRQTQVARVARCGRRAR